MRAALLLPFLFAPLTAQKPSEITTPTWLRARAVWFVEAQNPIGAEVGIGLEDLPFDAARQQAFTSAKDGDRLALGRTLWPTLDTYTDLELGGSKVPAGNHHLALERSKDGWNLLLFDSRQDRQAQVLPEVGARAKPTLRAPLQHKTGEAVGGQSAAWQPASKGGTAALVLRVGPHEFTAQVKVAGANGGQPIAQPDARGCSRLAFAPAKDGRQPFAVLDHGLPAWDANRANAAAGLAPGARWRLGKDWWTTLDTDTPLLLGGKKLAAGAWHLALGRGKDGWNLVVSSAEEDEKHLVDAFGAQLAKPVLELPLAGGKAEPAAKALRVGFAADGKEARLEVAFGDTRLSLPVAAGG